MQENADLAEFERRASMRTRVLTGIVALCVLIPILIFSNTFIFDLALAVCCVISVFEILKCVGTLKKLWISIPTLMVSPLIVLAIRPLKNTLDGFSFTQVTLPVLLIAMLYLLAVMVFSKNKITIEDVSVSGFMSAYIAAAFASILFLRDSTGGAYTYLLVFIGAWVTDVFAYFCGMLFGKHKLIPEVSPKKTVEGSIGGTLFCGGAFVLYGVLIDRFVEQANRMNLLLLFAYGIIVAVVSQVGDLCMSAIKRHYGIKDFGKIFPGHGGMLDRFDSILAVSLVLLVLNGFASVFNIW